MSGLSLLSRYIALCVNELGRCDSVTIEKSKK